MKRTIELTNAWNNEKLCDDAPRNAYGCAVNAKHIQTIQTVNVKVASFQKILVVCESL